MDTFSGALMLWLGLSSLVPVPNYEIEHFYTYDSKHKQQGLVLQGKVLLPYSKHTEKYIQKMKHKIVRDGDRWIVLLDSNKAAIDFMAQLSKDKVPYLPIVKWQDMDMVPSNTILIKTKPFVTEPILKKWLESRQVKIGSIKAAGRSEWLVEVLEPLSVA